MQLSRKLLRLQALGKHGEDRQGSALKQLITGWRAVPSVAPTLSAVPEGRKRGSGDRDGASSLT